PERAATAGRPGRDRRGGPDDRARGGAGRLATVDGRLRLPGVVASPAPVLETQRSDLVAQRVRRHDHRDRFRIWRGGDQVGPVISKHSEDDRLPAKGPYQTTEVGRLPIDVRELCADEPAVIRGLGRSEIEGSEDSIDIDSVARLRREDGPGDARFPETHALHPSEGLLTNIVVPRSAAHQALARISTRRGGEARAASRGPRRDPSARDPGSGSSPSGTPGHATWSSTCGTPRGPRG